MTDDTFSLYDLQVEWLEGEKPCWCGAKAGDCFYLRGEHLEFPNSQTWSIYTLSALLPLLPAKQRETNLNDWMSTDNLVACPDPNCGSRFGSIGWVGEHFLILKQQPIHFLETVSNEH
ncbi:MAG: TIGR04076 family protein [Gammaproteobacteria bacterium]|nr:MAG: TIGR04076 family protein [Gammaproteobacteria bacterium]